MMGITTGQSTAAIHKVTQADFKDHAEQQKTSGLSRLAYCRKHALNYDHFNYWLTKEKKMTRTLIPVRLIQPTEESFPPDLITPLLCTLTLKNGNVLQIYDQRIIPLILPALN